MQSLSNNTSIFYFDLDQTLFVNYRTKDSRHFLSESALLDLSDEAEGVIKDPILARKNGVEKKSYQVKAFAKEKFEALFQQINDVNALHDQPKILVRILTNNYYDENEIHAIITQFFGNVAFDGFANNTREVPGFSEEHTPGKLKPLPGKGMTMDHDYSQKYESMGIHKHNIYLIDDSERNCLDAEKYGFQAIRMGTNPKERGADISYTERKEVIFNTLSQIINQHRVVLA